MRIASMETLDFSMPALKVLMEVDHQVIAMIIQPDKPKGRGKEVQVTPARIRAMEYGIPVYQSAKMKEVPFVEVLQGVEVDVYVVIAFDQLLPEAVPELLKYGCIDIHASLPPKYRGATSIQWCVIGGERETGITTMMMDVGPDTRDMPEGTVIPIEEKETGSSLHDKLSLTGGALILSTFEKLKRGTLVRTPQTDEGTRYTKMPTKPLGGIDWNQSAVSTKRLTRGLNLQPNAYTLWSREVIKIRSAGATASREAAAFLSESGTPSETGITPGTIVCSGEHSLVVYTGDGLLSVRRSQMEGKKRMGAPAFLREYPTPEGDVFVKKKSN